MAQQQSSPKPSPQQPPLLRIRPQLIIWAILLLLLFLPYLGRMLLSPNLADIPYSEFKQQVVRGNVSEVTIQGEEIHGQFQNEYTRPSDAGGDGSTYTTFMTILPSLGDPELIGLLEDQQVTITARKDESS